MLELETEYRDCNAETAAEKIRDRAEAFVEQVDRETRLLLASFAKVTSRSIASRFIDGSETSERRRQKEKAESEARARKEKLECEIEMKLEELERKPFTESRKSLKL